MSNAVFPTIRGLGFSVTARPMFNTLVQTAASGKETRIALQSQSKTEFDLTYEYIKDNPSDPAPGSTYTDLELLIGFYMARQGAFDNFLWQHPYKNTAVSAPAVALSATVYQAQVSRGNLFSENIGAFNGVPSVYVGGVLQSSGVTVSSATNGYITFSSAPGGAVTWSGGYYYRVRFKDDHNDFENFLNQLYALKKLTLVKDLY